MVAFLYLFYGVHMSDKLLGSDINPKATVQAQTDMTETGSFTLPDDFNIESFRPRKTENHEVGIFDGAKAFVSGGLRSIEGLAEVPGQAIKALKSKADADDGILSNIAQVVENHPYIKMGELTNPHIATGLSSAAGAVENTFSDDAKAALNEPIAWKEGDNWKASSDPAVWGMQFSKSMGYMAPTIATALATGGASSAAALPNIVQAMIRSGANPQLAAKAAPIALSVLTKGATVGVGIGSDLGSQGVESSNTVLAADHSQLMSSEQYQQAFIDIDSNPEYANLSDGQKFELAKEHVSDQASRATMTDARNVAASVAATMLGDVPLANALLKGFKGSAGGLRGALGGAATGVVREAPMEAIQEGTQQRVSNEISNEYAGTNLDPNQGVTEAAVSGGLMGAAMGGGMGTVGGLRSATQPAPEAAPESVSENTEIDADQVDVSATADLGAETPTEKPAPTKVQSGYIKEEVVDDLNAPAYLREELHNQEGPQPQQPSATIDPNDLETPAFMRQGKTINTDPIVEPPQQTENLPAVNELEGEWIGANEQQAQPQQQTEQPASIGYQQQPRLKGENIIYGEAPYREPVDDHMEQQAAAPQFNAGEQVKGDVFMPHEQSTELQPVSDVKQQVVIDGEYFTVERNGVGTQLVPSEAPPSVVYGHDNTPQQQEPSLDDKQVGTPQFENGIPKNKLRQLKYLAQRISDKIPLAMQKLKGAARFTRPEYRTRLVSLADEATAMSNSKTINVQVDTISDAITKLGGVSRASAESDGIDPAAFKRNRLFPAKDGRTFDELAEVLNEHGFTSRTGGKLGANDVLDLVDSEVNNGERHFSTQSDMLTETDQGSALSDLVREYGAERVQTAISKALTGARLGDRQAEIVSEAMDVIETGRIEQAGGIEARHAERDARREARVAKRRQKVDAVNSDLGLPAWVNDDAVQAESEYNETVEAALDQAVSHAAIADPVAAENLLDQYEANKITMASLIDQLGALEHDDQQKLTDMENTQPTTEGTHSDSSTQRIEQGQENSQPEMGAIGSSSTTSDQQHAAVSEVEPHVSVTTDTAPQVENTQDPAIETVIEPEQSDTATKQDAQQEVVAEKPVQAPKKSQPIKSHGVSIDAPYITQETQDNYNRATHIGSGRDFNAELTSLANDQLNELHEKGLLDTPERIAVAKQSIEALLNKQVDFITRESNYATNNPSWIVTGRSGRNMDKVNKRNDRHMSDFSKRVDEIENLRGSIVSTVEAVRNEQQKVDHEKATKQAQIKKHEKVIVDYLAQTYQYLLEGKPALARDARVWVNKKVTKQLNDLIEKDKDAAYLLINKINKAYNKEGKVTLIDVVSARSALGKQLKQIIDMSNKTGDIDKVPASKGDIKSSDSAKTQPTTNASIMNHLKEIGGTEDVIDGRQIITLNGYQVNTLAGLVSERSSKGTYRELNGEVLTPSEFRDLTADSAGSNALTYDTQLNKFTQNGRVNDQIYKLAVDNANNQPANNHSYAAQVAFKTPSNSIMGLFKDKKGEMKLTAPDGKVFSLAAPYEIKEVALKGSKVKGLLYQQDGIDKKGFAGIASEHLQPVVDYLKSNTTASFSREGVTPNTNTKTKGMPLKQAEMAVKSWLRQYNGGAMVSVKVVQTQAEAEQILGVSLDGYKVNAFYNEVDATVVVVADNIANTKELRQKLRHEILVHHGLRAVVGDAEYGRILKMVYSGLDSRFLKPLIAEVEQGYDRSNLNNFVEEVLAHTAENERNQIQKWRDRIIASIAQVLRKVGLLTPSDITQAELNNIVQTLTDRIKAVNEWDPSTPPPSGNGMKGHLSRTKFSRTANNDSTSAFQSAVDQARAKLSAKMHGPIADVADAGFDIPTDNLKSAIARKLADKFQVLKELQKNIVKSGGNINEDNDAYLAEELFHGKAENDLRIMKDSFVKPLADKMAKHDISQAQLDEYLIARHAQERNDYIASINPKFPDGGSGMKNADAQAKLDAIRNNGKQQKYDELAHIVDAMITKQRDVLRDSGLETDEMIDTWQSHYKHYVPLKGIAKDESSLPRTGKGFAIGGKEAKNAMGRKSMAESPSGHAIIDLTEKLIRARKNEVGQSLLKLVQDNPSNDYWQVFTNDNPDTAPQIVERKNPLTGEKEKIVEDRPVPMAMLSDYYFPTKKDGKVYYIKLHDQRLMHAMKNMGPDTSNGVIRFMAGFNRILASVNTSYNPEFVVGNFARDIQTAILNLSAEQTRDDGKIKGEAIVKQVIKDTVSGKVMRAIYSTLRNKQHSDPEIKEWQRHFDEFMEVGGKTGWFDMKDVDGQAKELDRMVAMANGSITGKAYKAFENVTGFVENVNGSIENAVRLSAYVNARKAGISKKKAASLAKNMTVNFNRRGEVGTTLNAMYMFANASIQGSANFVRTMTGLNGDGKLKWQNLNNAQKIAIGVVAGSFALAFANRGAAGEDDDGVNWFDKIPSYVKERNFIIMKSLLGGEADGSYWSVPMPYGYNIFSVAGAGIESALNSDNVTPMQTAGSTALAMLGAFSPIGMASSDTVSGTVLKNALPTLGKPFFEVSTNENFFGGQIYQENMPFGTKMPDSSMAKRSTSDHYKAIAEWINQATGGSAYRSGAIDLSPDVMQYIVGFFGGAAMRFADVKVPGLFDMATGNDVEDSKVAFLSRISGRVMPYQDQSTFYDRRDELMQIKDEIKTIKGSNRSVYMQDHGYKLQLLPMLKMTEKQLKALRQRRNAIYALDLPRAQKDLRLKSVERQMKMLIDRFNLRYAHLQQRD